MADTIRATEETATAPQPAAAVDDVTQNPLFALLPADLRGSLQDLVTALRADVKAEVDVPPELFDQTLAVLQAEVENISTVREDALPALEDFKTRLDALQADVRSRQGGKGKIGLAHDINQAFATHYADAFKRINKDADAFVSNPSLGAKYDAQVLLYQDKKMELYPAMALARAILQELQADVGFGDVYGAIYNRIEQRLNAVQRLDQYPELRSQRGEGAVIPNVLFDVEYRQWEALNEKPDVELPENLAGTPFRLIDIETPWT